MTTDEIKDDDTRFQNKKVEPNFSLSPTDNIQNIPVLAADFAQVLTYVNDHTCTFVFFRRHPTVKSSDGNNIMLEGIKQELFLEVKMPLEATMALGVYLSKLLEEIRKNPEGNDVHFGPVNG